MPWKLKIEPSRERVALVVIEKEVTLLGRRKISEPAGDSAGFLRILMRIGEVEFGAVGDGRRIDAGLPAANRRMRGRKWKEDLGLPQNLMTKQVPYVSP